MDKRLSLLGLFHPDGSPRKSLVFGSNCPPRLHPGQQVDPDDPVDLIILAPSTQECSQEDWLFNTVGLFSSSLASDGVGFLLAPPRWRFRIAKVLIKSGLRVDQIIGYLPNWTASDYILPFSSRIARYAFSNRITKPAWKSFLARGSFHLPGSGQVLGRVWPSAGLIIRHPSARPPFEWLFKQVGAAYPGGKALVRTNWRGSQAVSLLYIFHKGETRPAAVAKVVLGDPASVDLGREANTLAMLGPNAQQAGVRVPQVLSLAEIQNHPYILQSLVDGLPVDDLLRSHPQQLYSTMAQITTWLERWHQQTVTTRPVNQDDLDHTILEPAALLAPLLERGDEYRNWLAGRCQAAVGLPGSFVATHNDLTMANLLIDNQGRLGVIDWEASQAEGWSLVDFFYAMTDAVMNANQSQDRLAAFKACFAPGGRYTSSLSQHRVRLEYAARLNGDLAELCFHACWLHHARNEYLKNRPEDTRPFLSILQWLALNSSPGKESFGKA